MVGSLPVDDGERPLALEQFEGIGGLPRALLFGDGQRLVFQIGLAEVEQGLPGHRRVGDPLFCGHAAEFRTGDRLQFNRNNRAAARNNGDTAEVVAIDADHGRVTIANQDGTRQTLDMTRLADRHVRHGWVRTIHSSQGATCDHVIAHLESFRANTVDAASAYVAINRARKGAAIYTDSRASLIEALGLRDGAQVDAIDGLSASQFPNKSSLTAPVSKRIEGKLFLS